MNIKVIYILHAVLLLSFANVHCQNNKTDEEDENGIEISLRDPCEDYCENGGKCEIVDGARTCICKEGTSGDRCDIIDDCQIEKFCDPEDILKCVYDGNRGDTCECRERRKHFDSFLKKCRKTCTDSEECENGAVCKSAGFSKEKFCQCHTGTSGDTCSIFEDCETENPCGLKSDVMCIKNGVAGGKCVCNDTKKKFDPEIKECRKTCMESKDCEYNSVCERNRDLDEKFCRCRSGTAGDTCSIVKYCDKENPCGLKNDVKCKYDILKGAGRCLCDDPKKAFEPFSKECRRRCNLLCGLDANIECDGDQKTYETTLCGCKIKTMVHNAGKRVCKNRCNVKCGWDSNIKCLGDQKTFETTRCGCRNKTMIYAPNFKACKDLCIPNPCRNAGRCYVEYGEAICRCKPPFTGTFCATDPCYSNPCQNGGKCLVEGTAYKCVCNDGFSGATCGKGNNWMTATVLAIAVILFLILLFGACTVFKINQRLKKITRNTVV